MYKHKCYKIYLSSLDGNYTCKLDALDHDVICNDISSVKNGSWIQELRTKKIFLTDIQENAGPIEILLGADVAGKLITGRREELETGLVALETKLGWTLMGKVPRYIDKKDASMNIVTMLSQADVPVSSLWDLELLGIRDPIEQNSREETEKAVMFHFIETIRQKEDGRYEVHMPWKVDQSATNVMKEGMFDLRGWESSAICASSESTRSPVLGLIWDKNLDTLEIDSESLEFDEREKITKRKILSLVSRVFDPIGFLAPVMIQPKILLQATWKTKESSDDEVNNEIKKQFLKWIKQLKYFKNIKIPRWLGVMKESNLSIHTFVDASKTAYAACIFLRSESSMGSVTVQLLQARSRITPMKTITIPRLELMAATIGARLFSSVTQALKLPNVKVYFWTDSSTVLTWITSREQWSVFVTNRISEIRKLTTSEDWFHIPTDQNPADILSRGCGPKQLQKHKWWQGPAWLKNSKEQWPKSTVNINKKEVETEKRKSVISANNTELESISLQLAKRFSRPIQRLYPLELTPNYEQVVPETQKVPEVVTKYPQLSSDSNETVPVSRSGREIKPVKRLDL
ncbi:reverse transcriptase [Caerostris darwini]|uniref:Reverse transcriptase n=1 Tax=Caerostris darwini TaxID=1538125 RepID=A0AAV4Q3C1_9ARAC|nr:reverse transcriptase [Caerostris darwini]